MLKCCYCKGFTRESAFLFIQLTLGTHGEILVAHTGSVKSGGHWHRKVPSNDGMQVPELKHGFGTQGTAIGSLHWGPENNSNSRDQIFAKAPDSP